MAGSSDKSITLDMENVRDIGVTYTARYSNATQDRPIWLPPALQLLRLGGTPGRSP
jgi:hypothetical protein